MLQDTESLFEVIKLSNKRYIIFDIFDTIIHRKIHPEDLKKIFSDRIVKFFSLTRLTPREVYELRASAEKKLCLNNRNSGYDLEFRFNDLCALLYENLKDELNDSLSKSEFIDIAREIEFTVEVTNQYIDESIAIVLKNLSKEGYTLLCCSDFYLDLDLITRFLNRYNLDQLFSNIYVSSEYLLTKRSGRLYDEILKEYPADMCLMIGDNSESDYRRAELIGIEAILLDRAWAYDLHLKHNINFNTNYIQNKLNKLIKANNQRLFPEFVFTSFYFIHELYMSLVKKGYKDVFFIAREGYVLKQMFDIYQNICIANPNLRIDTHYLMASRRSTFMPSLTKLEQEDFHNLFRQYKNISFAEFMYSLGFEDEDIDDLVCNLGIDKSRRERDFPNSETFIKTLISDDFHIAYENKRKEQKHNFQRYLNQFNRQDPSVLALVDVGWKGTIQDNIFKILDEKVSVEGFYIGLVASGSMNAEKNRKNGLLFSDVKTHKFSSVYNENRSLFEILYAANHGSVISFNEKGSDVYAKCEDFSNEVQFYKSNILPVIQPIMMNFKTLCSEYAKASISSDELIEFVTKAHFRMVFNPSYEELLWYLNLYHVENFGVFERNVFNKNSTNKISLSRRIASYLEFKKFPEKYTINSIWPAAEFAKGGLYRSMRKYSTGKFNSIFK